VGHVALAGSGFFEVDGPLLELTVATDLIGDEAWNRGVEFRGEVGVEIEFLRNGDAVGEELADDGHVHGAAGTGERRLAVGGKKVILGGFGRAGGEVAFAVFNEPGEEEFGGALHEGVRASAEEVAVAGEEVVLVEVSAEPGAAHAPVGPRGRAHAFADGVGGSPDVDVVVGAPAGEAVVFFGGDGAGLAEAIDEVEERTSAFGEVGGFGGPVVHLDVDVGSPVGAPRRGDLVVPNALEIRGLGAGAGAADEEIAAVLEVKREEGGIGVGSEVF